MKLPIVCPNCQERLVVEDEEIVVCPACNKSFPLKEAIDNGNGLYADQKTTEKTSEEIPAQKIGYDRETIDGLSKKKNARDRA